MDWAHNEESWQQYNEISSEMDPSRLSRQRKTKEHMEEDSEKELGNIKLSWSEAESKAQDQAKWQSIVVGLCSSRS